MAYFPDLSPYAYSGHHQPSVVHVGWLDHLHNYPKGEVPQRWLSHLKDLAHKPVELYRGLHYCELCPGQAGPGGCGEIRVARGGVIYAAPVLVIHYIEAHGYLPPAAFLQAVSESLG